MKYFFDTEFIEDGRTIDLISIGMVCEDGREYYAVSEEFDFGKASEWVIKNVLHPMGIFKPIKSINPSDPSISPNTRNTLTYAKSRNAIAEDILHFTGGEYEVENLPPGARGIKMKAKLKSGEPKPEFWAYFADYDWVVLCQLFGTMMNLPDGWPMFCLDLKQQAFLRNVELPKQEEGLHNAIADARWVKQSWEFLNT